MFVVKNEATTASTPTVNERTVRRTATFADMNDAMRSL